MALGKICANCTKKAGRNSIYCRNCRRLFNRWGERSLKDVVEREEDLTRWKAPVDARIHKERDKVTIIKRKRAA